MAALPPSTLLDHASEAGQTEACATAKLANAKNDS